MWLVQGAAIYINIAAPCTTEIHTENQHFTLRVKPRVQPRFLHRLLLLCFSCNPVIPKNKKSPKHFPFSVKISIFASVPRAERSNAAKPAQLPNRYRLPNFLLFKSYLPTDYKKTIVFDKKIEPEDVAKEYLSVEELYCLAETPCKIPVLKTASLFSCLTSLRLSDVLSLCWEEIVDFAAGGKCVHTITQKTKTEDIIPISDEALKLIGYSPEKKGLVFKGLKRSWTQQPMKEWIRSAGIIKNITFHSYRRTYATLQAAAGTDIRTIQSNMAHKSITTTQRYMKVVDSNKREATTRITLTRKG